ncbi:MAG TPA: hypothetical protein VEZ12_10950, partial [Herpetosiphonaceae bacterium]|nr:hypothetical protein [Herpetosiphonaceae bacterium]
MLSGVRKKGKMGEGALSSKGRKGEKKVLLLDLSTSRLLDSPTLDVHFQSPYAASTGVTRAG